MRFKVIRNPHALWIAQQMREAGQYASAHPFLNKNASVAPACRGGARSWQPRRESGIVCKSHREPGRGVRRLATSWVAVSM